jgi:hypothetical protein
MFVLAESTFSEDDSEGNAFEEEEEEEVEVKMGRGAGPADDEASSGGCRDCPPVFWFGLE